MSSDPRVFHPPRRPGLIFHAGVIILLAAGGLGGLWGISKAVLGPSFILLLLPVVLAFLGIPVFAYFFQALHRSEYILERDGIRLIWGLRVEEIPMDRVLWIKPASDLENHPPLPLLCWPGAVFGKRPGKNGISVEYFASRKAPLLLIGVPDRIFAISPEDPKEFLKVYHRMNELGSLSPIPARSAYPSLLWNRYWSDLPARILLLTGILLSLALVIAVISVIPFRGEISLRPAMPGPERRMVPSVQLIILPLISSVFFTIDLLVGLFFYRRSVSGISQAQLKGMAYVLWTAGAVTPLIFLIGVIFIIM
jgi:hypothetical protein